jgi:hypothetical protein
MSKAKMKFPPVPGDTPREQFMNLVHHVITLPKAGMIEPSRPQRKVIAKKAKGRVVASLRPKEIR